MLSVAKSLPDRQAGASGGNDDEKEPKDEPAESAGSRETINTVEIVQPEPATQTRPADDFVLSQKIERIGREESLIEPKALALVLDAIQLLGREGVGGEFGQGTLIEYFRQKKEDGLYEFADAETLAQEVLELDDKLIAPARLQLQEKFAGRPPAGGKPMEISGAMNSLREALLSPILGGKITAEKIIGKINGGMLFKDKPGDEVGNERFDPEKIAAYFKVSDGTATEYFYESLFREKPEAQALHGRHEFAHILAETGSIWEKEIYQSFIAAAQNSQPETISKFSAYPELQEILKAISAPERALPLYRRYIRDRFKAIEETPDERAKQKLRGGLAREMTAEMVAAYLENGASPEAFLNSRLRFANCDISQYCLDQTGLSFDGLCRKYEITPENFDMTNLLEKSSEVPELSPLFRANKVWFEKLSKTFANRGEAIPDGIASDIDVEYLEFFEVDDFDISPSFPGQSEIGSTGEGAGGAKNFFETVWDFLTGKKSAPEGFQKRLAA